MEVGRRQAIALSAAAAAAATGARAQERRRIRLGLVGCGGRGAWIAGLFARDGGYAIHAVADYFPEEAERCGTALGVDQVRRFSGLDGHRRLLDSGVEAVALEVPPCFFPLHAEAAVAAGKHVYMAKPIAADVPGCRRVEDAARRAGAASLCFLIDYQMPTEPANIRIVDQVRAGAIGTPIILNSYYLANAWNDPPLTSTIESRLRGLIWVNDDAMGSGYHGNGCIHAIDAAMWLADAVPTAAMGASRIGRPGAHGDSHDVLALTYEFASGLILQHRGKHLPDMHGGGDFCGVSIHGQKGYAQIAYNGKATLMNAENPSRDDVQNLYEAGACRNIAAFHRAIVAGDASNPTVRRGVDSALATILGREAGRRHRRLTMADLLRENRALPVSLKGLKR